MNQTPDVRELQKQAREADRIDKNRAELFEAMLRTEAWKAYIELLDAKIQALADQVMRPAMNMDELIALEAVKGPMRGLLMARDLPSTIIAAMKTANSASATEEND